jgi:hypothetical protein
MKQVEVNSRVISIPSSVWEMDLGPFLDVMTELQQRAADPEGDSLLHQMRLVSYITGLPLSEIEELPFPAFVQLAELATLDEIVLPEVVTPDEAGLDESRKPISFQVTDEHGTVHEFAFQPDFVMNKVKHVSKAEDILRGMDLMANLHRLLALTAWREGETFNENTLEEKNRLMCRAKMSEVYRPLFFFALQGRGSSLFTRLFSRDKATAVEPTRSIRNGDGTA